MRRRRKNYNGEEEVRIPRWHLHDQDDERRILRMAFQSVIASKSWEGLIMTSQFGDFGEYGNFQKPANL